MPGIHVVFPSVKSVPSVAEPFPLPRFDVRCWMFDVQFWVPADNAHPVFFQGYRTPLSPLAKQARWEDIDRETNIRINLLHIIHCRH